MTEANTCPYCLIEQFTDCDAYWRRWERRGFWTILIALLALGAVAVAHAAPVPVVWFVYDQSMIAPVATLAEKAPVTAVINPNNGPGSTRDAAYANAVDKWRKIKGIKLMAYVDLAIWKQDRLVAYKTPAQVRAEIAAYNSIYGITTSRDGIWYDDASLTSSAVQAFFAVATVSKLDVANPGEPVPAKQWLRKLPLRLCEFEDPFVVKSPPVTTPGAVWICFVTSNQIPAALTAGRKASVSMMGWEALERHHNGEFQRPPLWWKNLVNLNQ